MWQEGNTVWLERNNTSRSGRESDCSPMLKSRDSNPGQHACTEIAYEPMVSHSNVSHKDSSSYHR
jgi:hypothetical protein